MILFKNAQILTMDEGMDDVLNNACILVDGNRIEYVGNEEGLSKDTTPSRIIDAGGKLLMPGFINGHTHIAMSLFRGHADDMPLMEWLQDRIWPMEERLDAQAVYTGSLLSIAEMLSKGITCINDMYFFMDDIAKACIDSGIRAVLSWAILDKQPNLFERIETSTKYFEKYDGMDGRIKISFGPHAEYTCSKPVLKAAAQRAGELGCRLHIHVAESFAETEQCKERWGLSPVAYLDAIDFLGENVSCAHCVHLSDKDIDIMARAGASVLHCPNSNLKLGSGIAPVDKMLKAGVNVCLGTDSAASNNKLDIWEEMRTAALLQKGAMQDASAVNAKAAVEMATINGAKALGLEKVGAIKKGYAADIIMIDMDKLHYYPNAPIYTSLVYGGSSADVVMTMVNGKILYQDGKFNGIDIDSLKKEISTDSLRMRGE